MLTQKKAHTVHQKVDTKTEQIWTGMGPHLFFIYIYFLETERIQNPVNKYENIYCREQIPTKHNIDMEQNASVCQNEEAP